MNRYIAGLLQVSTALAVSLGCYLVSAHVAAERAGVAQLRSEIARDTEAMRGLDAELHTRARLPQLQSWNDQALLMSAPAPAQMLAAPAQLVAYLPGGGVTAAMVQAVARQAAIAPKSLPTIEAAAPDAAPIMAAQVAVRSPISSPRALTLASLSPRDRAGESLAPDRDRRDTPGKGGGAAAITWAADPVAELAARAPKVDTTSDVADLTSAIGRELKADTSTRRVSLR
jgi:hypothetical protein